MSEERKAEDRTDEIEDLEVSEHDAEDVKGGRKAGKPQQEYLVVKLEDVQITSYNVGP